MANGSSFTRKKIVSIGGGNGPYLVGRGLRDYDVDITIICTPADNGGSSGRIRDEFGKVLPPGDLRRGIMALMNTEDVMDHDFFNHRFGGNGLDIDELTDHSLGNIILLAAHQRFGPIQGTAYVAKKFGVKGKVLPMSTDSTHLHVMLNDGTEVQGETNIDLRDIEDERLIVREWLQPQAFICKEAADAIRTADVVILGPGDLYTSIIPNLLVSGVQDAMKESKAKFICIMNQMDKWSETRGFTAADFLQTMIDYGIGRPAFDAVIVDSSPIPPEVADFYARKEKSFPVKVGDATRVHKLARILHPVDLLHITEPNPDRLVRHDSQKLAHAILEVVYMEERYAYDRIGTSELVRKIGERRP